MKVEIITDEFCKWCDKAKELMQNRNILYTELQLEDSFETMKKYNLKTVPQIFVDGNLIGGYTDLEKNIEEIVSGKTKT